MAALQGIPTYDTYVTDIEKAATVAEARNTAKEIGRDHRLTAGQKETLMSGTRRKIALLERHIDIDEGKGGGATSIVNNPSESQPGPLAPQTAVLPTPIITPAEMSAAIDRYNEHAKVLESKPGYVVQIKGKPFRTKAFWRAIARIYSVSSERVAYQLETEMRGEVFVRTHTVTVRAYAPNGKFADGMGQASNAEPNKKDHTDHMLSALAYTRATNRAISDLCGFGEPSAEEVEE